MKVGRGDKLNLKVKAFFVPQTSPGSSTSLQVYVSSPSSTPTGSEQLQKEWSLLNVGISRTTAFQPVDNSLPKAYLQYLCYDKDQKLIKQARQPVTPDSANSYLTPLTLDLEVEEDGYVQVLLANEGDVDVWFDDLEIIYQQAQVVQENHYSPWGLNLAGIEKQGNPDHKFQYNGKEKQEELGLNWIDYGARMYDPQLGRWHVMDAMMEAIPSITPYNYVLNNPIRLIDPTGMWTVSPEGGIMTNDPQEIANFLRSLKSSLESNAKQNTAKAITRSAEFAHQVYNDLSSLAEEHPEMIGVINFALGAVSRRAQAKDMSPDQMEWGDVFNVWVMELGDYDDAGNPIRFGPNAKTTTNLKTQEGVQQARIKALAAVKDGKDRASYVWVYGQKEFYDCVSQRNGATFVLGSYSTVVDISYNEDGTATLNYTVTNV